MEESFSIHEIEKHGLPTKHYEHKTFIVDGDKRCGKTILTIHDLAYKAWELWGKEIDAIDFIIAEDIYASIDAIATSKYPVHFVILDDQISKLDSRNPMGNKTVTELYFEIAHELQRRSRLMGGNLGGLVICAILTQKFNAIDLRLRGDEMFTIFKTYDKEGLKEYEIYDPEIERLLLEWKVRSNRLTDYEVRKWAFVIDRLKEGCLIYFDATDYLDEDSPTYKKLPFEFKIVRGIDRYREQRNNLVDYLVQNYNLFKMSKEDLKTELYEKRDELEAGLEKCRITPYNFTEIILKARKKYKKLHKHEIDTQKVKQKIELIEYLYTTFDMQDYTDAELKGELFYKLDEMVKDLGEDNIFVSKKDFLEIVWRAKKKYRDNQNQRKKKEEVDPRKKSLRERIIGIMKNEKPIFSIQELDERIPEYDNQSIGSILAQNPEDFENLIKGKGVYKLVEYEHTDEELIPYKKQLKQLIMKEREAKT